MHCPACRSQETRVIDSRLTQEGMAVRRRRVCEACDFRFSTIEEMQLLDVTIVKSNGRKEAYSRNKLMQGILKSLAKRPYTQQRFDRLVYAIERDIQKKKRQDIRSRDIGEIVMRHLRKFDKVAYIRFASIYRAFQDVDTFQDEIRSLETKKQGKRKKRG